MTESITVSKEDKDQLLYCTCRPKKGDNKVSRFGKGASLWKIRFISVDYSKDRFKLLEPANDDHKADSKEHGNDFFDVLKNLR